MATLTHIESKLAEVAGLATAAAAAVEFVEKLVPESESQLRRTLERMRDEARETRSRCDDVAAGFDGKKTAIQDEARATKQKATGMLEIYLDADSESLDGIEFLTMAEAAEVGHWVVLREMNRTAGDARIAQLVDWALPIQQRHLSEMSDAAVHLAGKEDPIATA
jgi:hypothetical protein